MDESGFERLINQLRAFTPRHEIILEEVPAPQKLAMYSFAFSVDVSNGRTDDEEDELASGRFVLLHEPGGQDTWEGEFRCVSFVRADVDNAMQEDPSLPEFGWGWFLSALDGLIARSRLQVEPSHGYRAPLLASSRLAIMNQRLRSVHHGHPSSQILQRSSNISLAGAL